MEKIKIIRYPDKYFPFVAIFKPTGMPSAPLKKDEEYNAVFQTSKLFPDILLVKGKKEIEGGLLHRLDTETSGVLLFSTCQESYNYMMKQQESGNFIKKYSAICEKKMFNTESLKGFPKNEYIQKLFKEKKIHIDSYFRNYGENSSQVRPVTKDSGYSALKKTTTKKIYETEIQLLEETDIIKAECRIKIGYRHQVRCHLAWCNIPVMGDKLYNFATQHKTLEFRATEVEFINPFTGKVETIKMN